MKQVYLIISIDTECDKGPGWKLQRPMAFENIIMGQPQNLAPLFGQYSIKPTYLLSPEVMQHADSVSYFKSLKHVELGTHLHIEFIEPAADWEADRTKGIQADLDSGVEYDKLKNLTSLFKDQFGYQPSSFRAGRFGIGKDSFQHLHQLGYAVDSSVTPFKTHYYESGTVNNFWGCPVHPYRISNTDLIQVPVSIANEDFSKLPSWIVKNVKDKRTLSKRVLGRLGYKSKSKWFRPFKSDGKDLMEVSEQLIKSTPANKTPVLNMMFHSNEIWPAASPYCQTEEEVRLYCKALKEVFDFLHDNYAVCSIGLGEYAKYFK
ncbi:MAG: hypothetical protein KDC93_18690 [Cyclobacteriaceae bacterium]|nr:hypothetical protein [Cyclobacteriaceae bacterium]